MEWGIVVLILASAGGAALAQDKPHQPEPPVTAAREALAAQARPIETEEAARQAPLGTAARRTHADPGPDRHRRLPPDPDGSLAFRPWPAVAGLAAAIAADAGANQQLRRRRLHRYQRRTLHRRGRQHRTGPERAQLHTAPAPRCNAFNRHVFGWPNQKFATILLVDVYVTLKKLSEENHANPKQCLHRHRRRVGPGRRDRAHDHRSGRQGRHRRRAGGRRHCAGQGIERRIRQVRRDIGSRRPGGGCRCRGDGHAARPGQLRRRRAGGQDRRQGRPASARGIPAHRQHQPGRHLQHGAPGG